MAAFTVDIEQIAFPMPESGGDTAVKASGGEIPRKLLFGGIRPTRRAPGPLHAASPQFRESGAGLIGVGISPRKKIASPRIAKILHRMGLTITQFNVWCGFSTAEWVAANPSWTEREFFELLTENINTIRDGVDE